MAEIERLNRLYSALSQVNQAIARTRSRDELFRRVCRVLVTHGGFRMAWIGWNDLQTHRLVPVAEAGDEAGYLQRVEIYTDERPEGLGPSGRAFRANRPHVCNDIAKDPSTIPWREELTQRGLRASAAFPIHAGGQAVGMLSVYAGEPGHFRDKEIALLVEAAGDISFALDTLANEEARHRAEKAVKRLMAVVESTDDAIISETVDGAITSWNPAAEAMFGYTAAEMLGRSIEVLIPPGLREEQQVRLQQVRGGARIKQYEAIRRRKDGAELPVSITVSPIWSTDPETGSLGVIGVSRIIRDATEQKRAEALALNEQRFASGLIEAMPGVFYNYDAQGRFLRWNENFERVTGYSKEEIAGMHPLDFIAEEERPLLERRIAEVFETGEASVEASLRAKDGATVPYYLTGKRVIVDGAPRLVGVGVDVSARKRAERALRELNENLEGLVAERTVELERAMKRAEEADHLKSAFLATMSHELRTPLNSIIGFTGIVLKGMAGPLTAEQQKQLGMVQGSARHLLELINDVLDLSKIEAGQLEVRRAPFDLREAVERVAASVTPLAEKKGLALRVVVPPGLEPLVSDHRRVEQIVLNLLHNAIKFTDRGEVSCEVLVEPGGEALRVLVSDTGIGIKPGDLAKLFQPFRQIDSGLQRQHEGTGLGLAISRRLTELLGGRIHASSVFGRGSTFSVLLPMKDEGSR